MTKDHIGLKILGVLAIISGLIMIVAGVTMMSAGTAVTEEASDSIFLIPILIPVGFALAIMGIAYAIIGLIFAVIGIYIFKERRWAFWLTFILSFFGLILAVVGGSIITLIISLIIFIYLFRIREDFSKSKSDVTAVS